MGCNVKDVCLSFLYMESLKKRGLLENLTEDMKEKMVSHAVDRLKMLSETRDKIMSKKKSLNGFPSVNFISKDYGNFLDFEDTFTKPSLSGSVETVFDIETNSDISILEKFENMSIHIPNLLDGEVYPRYENRENVIISTLREDTIIKKLQEELSFRSEDLVEYIFLDEVEAKLSEANLVDTFKDQVKSAFTEWFSCSDEDFEKISVEAYLPIRINNKVLNGIEIDKEGILNLYLSKFKESLKYRLKDAPLEMDEIVENVFQDERNLDFIYPSIDKVQESSDREMLFFIQSIASSDFKSAKNTIALDSTILKSLIAEYGETKKGDTFEIDLINSGKTLQLLPESNKTEAKINYIDTYLMIPSKENPAEFIKKDLVAEKITLKSKMGTKSTVYIESFSEKDGEVPKKKMRNISKSKSYKIRKDFTETFDKEVFGESLGNRRTMINDEADQNAGGQLGNIFSYVFKNYASKILVSTGTPVNGYPESSVHILKFGGNMSLEDVDASMVEFESLYGVYRVKSEILALTISAISSSEPIRESIENIYREIKILEKDKDTSINISEEYVKGFKVIATMLVSEEYLEKEASMSLDVDKESISLKIFFDAIEKAESKLKGIDFVSLTQTALVNTPALTKREPRISSIKGFASTFFATAGTASVSSTDAGIRKDTIFEDSEKILENFQKDSPRMGQGVFSHSNRGGARVAQALLKAYANNTFLSERYEFLNSNYKGFIHMVGAKNKSGSELRNNILKSISYHNPSLAESLTESDFYTLMQKTTTSSSDNFEDYYKHYLRNNGSLTKLEKEDDPREAMRLELFKETLLVFNSFLLELPNINEKKNKDRLDRGEKKERKGKEEVPFIVTLGNGIMFNFTGATYKYSASYKKGVEAENILDVNEDILNRLNGKSFPDNAVFSVELDLCPHDLREFIVPDDLGRRIPYLFELINKEENQILDVLGSLGAKEKMKQQMLSGANLVVLSQRVFTNSVNTLNYLSAYNEILNEYQEGTLGYEEKNNVEKTLIDNARIIINMTSLGGDRFNLKSVFDRIKNISGVEIMPTKRTVLDGTTKKSVVYDNKNISLFSHYASVSRGFALDYLHKDVEGLDGSHQKAHATLNFTDPVGGGNGIQALSRLESPKTDKNLISLYNGGDDARLLFFGEDANKMLNQMLPVSSSVSSRGEDVYIELQKNISDILSLPKKEGDEMAEAIVTSLGLGIGYAPTETTINAKKTETAVKTYNMVMEGAFKDLSESERENLYLKKPIIDISAIPEIEGLSENAVEDNNIQQNESMKLSEEDKSVFSEICQENEVDINSITKVGEEDSPIGYHVAP